MKIAIPVWNNYISTVCDFSNCLLFMELESNRIINRSKVSFIGSTSVGKAFFLKKNNVQLLLCGAISKSLEMMIVTSGISVIPFLCGTTDEIIEAYLTGRIFDTCFTLPGCKSGRCLRKGERRGRRRGWEKYK